MSKDDHSDIESSSDEDDSPPPHQKHHSSAANGTNKNGTNGYLTGAPFSYEHWLNSYRMPGAMLQKHQLFMCACLYSGVCWRNIASSLCGSLDRFMYQFTHFVQFCFLHLYICIRLHSLKTNHTRHWPLSTHVPFTYSCPSYFEGCFLFLCIICLWIHFQVVFWHFLVFTSVWKYSLKTVNFNSHILSQLLKNIALFLCCTPSNDLPKLSSPTNWWWFEFLLTFKKFSPHEL